MLDSLKVFLLVVEHESFRKAAEAVGLTRPAVSHRIKHLETHFDLQLLERTTRRVALTPAGRLLAERAAAVLAAMEELEADMQQVRARRQTTLTIGASTLPAEKCLSPALIRLQPDLAEHGLKIYTRVGNTDQVLGWLDAREVDLAIVGRDADGPHLECRPFAVDSIVLAVPPPATHPGHDLPDPVPLERLKTLPLILREPGSATRQAVLEQLSAHGVELADLNVVAEMGSGDSIAAAVQAGVGCAFFSTNQLRDSSLPVRRLADVELQRPLALCRRKEPLPSPQFESIFEALPRLLADTLT